MIIKENGRLFIALPECYTLEDIGAFQLDFLNVLASVNAQDVDVERIKGAIRFFMEMVCVPCQMYELGLGKPDQALDKDSGLKLVDERR